VNAADATITLASGAAHLMEAIISVKS
jgi:hypothetical protein